MADREARGVAGFDRRHGGSRGRFEERLARGRVDEADELSAGAVRELGLDPGKPRRESKKPAGVSPFGIGRSRGRPPGSPDRLPAVDGPVAKSETRYRVNLLATHERLSFLPGDRRRALSCQLEGSVGGFRNPQPITSVDAGPVCRGVGMWIMFLRCGPRDWRKALQCRPVTSSGSLRLSGCRRC